MLHNALLIQHFLLLSSYKSYFNEYHYLVCPKYVISHTFSGPDLTSKSGVVKVLSLVILWQYTVAIATYVHDDNYSYSDVINDCSVAMRWCHVLKALPIYYAGIMLNAI